jgi:R2.llaJI
MIAIINFIDEKTINKQFYYGTDKFEIIWEKLIDNFFGEDNKKDYFPHGL